MNPEVHIPGWDWYYVAMYFFIGGVSAGAYFIGTLAELFGGERHREISRTGFYIAFPLILLTPPLLIADLGLVDPGDPVQDRELLLDRRPELAALEQDLDQLGPSVLLGVDRLEPVARGDVGRVRRADALVDRGGAGQVPGWRIST